MGLLVDRDDLDPSALAAAPDDPAAGLGDRLGHNRPPGWVERASQAWATAHRAVAVVAFAEAFLVQAAGADRRSWSFIPD